MNAPRFDCADDPEIEQLEAIGAKVRIKPYLVGRPARCIVTLYDRTWIVDIEPDSDPVTWLRAALVWIHERLRGTP